ncbi:hypothetical protein WJX79_010267 [Trebouxia sp. C0005]
MASPKASKEDQVQALFTKLAPLIKGQQHKKAVRTIDSILKLQPGDQDAVKCKVAVLLEGSSFQEALEYINALPANSFQFEQAYALYRLNRLQDSLQILAQNMPDTPAKSLLEAQLQHRLGNYTAAIATYNKLVQQHKVKSLEVGTNVVAAYVSGGRAHEVPAVMDALALKASDGFEIAFNQACADVAVGKLDAAEQQLLLAQRLGRETLYEDDVPEEEVEAELAPLTSQLAYVASRLGSNSKACQLKLDLLKTRYLGSAALALVEASLLVKDGSLAAADKLLTGLQSDRPVISLQAVLMRAQMAVTNDDQAQAINILDSITDEESNLPPLPKLTGVNLDDLEAKVAGSRASRGVSKKRPSEADLANGAPDPERWLPKWQRSDFKKKRNRRREKATVKGSQGAGRVDDALDSTIEGNEPVAEASKPKGPARPAGAKGKKKGRR